MYAVKVFNGNLTYKDTINPRDIVGDFRFSANINSSMGPITIVVNKPFADDTYRGGDIIKVFAITEENKAGSLAYGGVITKVRRKADEKKELIELDCLGYSQLMSFTAVEGISTNNRPPQDIVADIIAFLNTKYPGYFYIDTIGTGANISYGIQNFSTALQHLEKIIELTGRSRFIGPDGGLKIGEKPTTPTHKLTYRKDVSEVEVEEDSTEIVNKAIVERSTTASTTPGPFNQFFETIQDPISIAQYGERTRYFPGTIRAEGYPIRLIFYGPIGLSNAIAFGNSQLKTEPTKTTRVKVNNKYDYFSITPFDTIRILNKNYQIVNLQVLKATYYKGYAMLELENIQNLGTLGKKLLG